MIKASHWNVNNANNLSLSIKKYLIKIFIGINTYDESYCINNQKYKEREREKVNLDSID